MASNDVYLHRWGGADLYMVSGRYLWLALWLLIILYVCTHFSSFFPLINFVVKIMYLQIIYQHKALQMPKMIKQKVLQLACKLMRYGITKIHHIFPMEYKTCTNKVRTFSRSKVICTCLSLQSKSWLVAQGTGNMNIV